LTTVSQDMAAAGSTEVKEERRLQHLRKEGRNSLTFNHEGALVRVLRAYISPREGGKIDGLSEQAQQRVRGEGLEEEEAAHDLSLRHQAVCLEIARDETLNASQLRRKEPAIRGEQTRRKGITAPCSLGYSGARREEEEEPAAD
jgi:hypothetical protein